MDVLAGRSCWQRGVTCTGLHLYAVYNVPMAGTQSWVAAAAGTEPDLGTDTREAAKVRPLPQPLPELAARARRRSRTPVGRQSRRSIARLRRWGCLWRRMHAFRGGSRATSAAHESAAKLFVAIEYRQLRRACAAGDVAAARRWMASHDGG